jgi:hypothetical protein
MSRVATVMMGILIVLLATILGLAVWSMATGRGASHQQILDQQERIDDHLAYLSCLLLTPPEDRTPEVVASCQVSS